MGKSQFHLRPYLRCLGALVGAVLLGLFAVANPVFGQIESESDSTQQPAAVEGSDDAEESAASEVDFFTAKVAPVIKAKCLRCHNDEQPAGDVNFDNFDWVENFVDPESIDSFAESSLSTNLLSTSSETVMPPDGKLNGHHIGVFFEWVEDHEGAVPESIEWDSISDNIKLDAEPLPEDTATLSWILAGKLHPAVLHFPVALLMVSAFLAIFGMGNQYTDKAAFYCLVFGTLGAIASCVSGWSFGEDKGWDWVHEEVGSVSWLHRWGGISTAALSTIVLIIAFFSRNKENGSQFLWKLGVFVLAGLVAAVGHFGGKKSHGDYTHIIDKLLASFQSAPAQPPADKNVEQPEKGDSSEANSDASSKDASDDVKKDESEMKSDDDSKGTEEAGKADTEKTESKDKTETETKKADDKDESKEDSKSGAKEGKKEVEKKESTEAKKDEKKSDEKESSAKKEEGSEKSENNSKKKEETKDTKEEGTEKKESSSGDKKVSSEKEKKDDSKN